MAYQLVPSLDIVKGRKGRSSGSNRAGGEGGSARRGGKGGKARLGGDGGVIGSGSSNEISLSDSDITPSEDPELDASS